MWDIEVTVEFTTWYQGLTDADANSVNEVVDKLASDGPALGRPLVDVIKTSRHPNMKELRPRHGHLRIMFAFDPRRSAILLIGGDKSGQWRAWYQRFVPIADDLFDEHLDTLKKEDLK